MTDAQKIDLAKWLTIYAMSGETSSNANALGYNYLELASRNGIKFMWSAQTTIVDNVPYYWGTDENQSTSTIENKEQESLALINSIDQNLRK